MLRFLGFFYLIIFGACRRTLQIFQPIMKLRVHHPLHSIWSNYAPCYLQEGDWFPPMFFSFRRFFGVCLCLCFSPSMLSRICHIFHEHKHVCVIHGKKLIDVPFGMFLSRGLDSFLVITMASQHLNDIEVANVWGAQLHIFSVNFKVTINFD